MSEECDKLLSELENIAGSARSTFGGFSAEQINWKPSETGWSVGQCFEHLIKTNELFYDELEKIAAGARKNSFWESWSPLTSFGGNFLINSLKKDERKFKAPTPKIVPPSAVDAAIIEKFAAHQAELIDRIKKCEAADWKKTVITSPFVKLMTYRLSDGFTVVVEHEKRHFRQAERILNLENFPR
jgi:hypothetical protein